MDCKNCQTAIRDGQLYCDECGAKVVTKRITARNLASDFVQNNLGWDNRFLRTIKDLITKPGFLLRRYFEGTRKKYVAPFTFLAIGMAMAIFTFNFFDEQFVRTNQDFQQVQLQWMADVLGDPFTNKEFQKEQLAQSEKITRFQLKYFNIMVVLLLPIYSFIAFLIYRKPYNYGEHLIVNSYVQGVSFLSISILFMISLVTHPLVYILNTLLLIVFYTYVYGKLYKLSFGQSILKVFLFIAVSLGIAGAIFAIGFIAGMIIANFS